MKRRIFGLETEYGVWGSQDGPRRFSPDEVARYLFRKIVDWGRSSNIFLENGARLYLDVGSHPEYATPECVSVSELVAHDKAGEQRLEDLRQATEQSLLDEGVHGKIILYKNNTDSAGNSYGCHENYLAERRDNFEGHNRILIPFLITRQIFAGAGKVLKTPRGSRYCLSQRAEHIWESISSATTRSRPIINTRDEPHADSEHYRRLHVIVGDSNMSEYATFLKVATCSMVLQMLEGSRYLRDMTLDNPIRAIREISGDQAWMSNDTKSQCKVPLASGMEVTALQMQWDFLEMVTEFISRGSASEEEKLALSMWEHCLNGLSSDPLSLEAECDWVAKYKIIQGYQQRYQVGLDAAVVTEIDMKYHALGKDGIFNRLEKRGLMKRICADKEIASAMNRPPKTRAYPRSRFIMAAKARNRDYNVDWVHLKLNDQAQQTILLKDPFAWQDDRVDRLISSL